MANYFEILEQLDQEKRAENSFTAQKSDLVSKTLALRERFAGTKHEEAVKKEANLIIFNLMMIAKNSEELNIIAASYNRFAQKYEHVKTPVEATITNNANEEKQDFKLGDSFSRSLFAAAAASVVNREASSTVTPAA